MFSNKGRTSAATVNGLAVGAASIANTTASRPLALERILSPSSLSSTVAISRKRTSWSPFEYTITLPNSSMFLVVVSTLFL